MTAILMNALARKKIFFSSTLFFSIIASKEPFNPSNNTSNLSDLICWFELLKVFSHDTSFFGIETGAFNIENYQQMKYSWLTNFMLQG